MWVLKDLGIVTVVCSLSLLFCECVHVILYYWLSVCDMPDHSWLLDHQAVGCQFVSDQCLLVLIRVNKSNHSIVFCNNIFCDVLFCLVTD